MLTNITCPGCGELISVEEDDCDLMVECGGRGEGSCDACYDLSNTEMVRACCAAQDEAERAYWTATEPDVLSLLADAEENA